MQTYKGSCHCGEIKYEIQAQIEFAIDCNCSICSKKGTLLVFVQPDHFKQVSGEGFLTDYQFYKKRNHHSFCKRCGVTPFLSVLDPKGNDWKAINVRTLDGIDISSLEIKHNDGRSF